ncbi:MAG: competence/damage-inducible protein A [Acidimicrobiales bacterium]|nr:competence/damage-inducible protein A [Acidimicrobiales bacterium]
MKVEVITIGTELLLGQIVDTNAAWLATKLAESGFDCYFRSTVGDNQLRIVQVIREALARNDAVVITGGLGPTQDDISRQAIAEVMNVELVRHDDILELIKTMFASRKREMPESNALQADVPKGATPIVQKLGTAPGLICPVGNRVIYALPGVPHEMKEMFERAVIPDLNERSGESHVIVSRNLATWGLSESALADMLHTHIEELDAKRASDPGVATLAYQASGKDGIKIRIATKGLKNSDDPIKALEVEENFLKSLIGDHIFSTDGNSMEQVVANLIDGKKLTLSTAESLTGGLLSSRLVNVQGASSWYRGGIVTYQSEVKFAQLGVERGPVISAKTAFEMARGVREKFGSDIGVGITGVAGPSEQEGNPAGTVWISVVIGNDQAQADVLNVETEKIAVSVHLAGGRNQIREMAAMSALDMLRRRLISI